MRTENVNKKNRKLPIRDIRVMLPKVVTALEECMEWMESIRASGDAGFFEIGKTMNILKHKMYWMNCVGCNAINPNVLGLCVQADLEPQILI